MKKVLIFLFILFGILVFLIVKEPEEIKNIISIKKIEKIKSASFVIAGDVMLDRLVYHQFKDKGLVHIFDNFGPRVFAGVDLAMINLEGPISHEPIDDNPTAGYMVFNFPPETAKILKSININAVSLANNHTLNNKSIGFEMTKKILSDEGIKYFGSQATLNDESVLRIDSGLPISVIGVNTLENFDRQLLISLIKKEGDRFVIIFPHWGNEYQTTHSPSQQQLAYEWIDNGADFVVGSHPHVVQDYEIYKNKLIVYSLGNFVFDQTFSPETQKGLLVSGVVKNNEVRYYLMPLESINLMPQLKTGEAKEINLPYN